MLDAENMPASPQGTQLLSYALGELDEKSQQAVEQSIAADPVLRDELEEIRGHLRLHQTVRKVAPRRGSFDRLRARMKGEGAFDGAIPGAHCMLRRSFLIALFFGIVAIVLLVSFSDERVDYARTDVIGEIVFHNPGLMLGQKRDEVERRTLQLKGADDEADRTGAYDAFLWLPTGVSNTYSSIEAGQNTEFKFTETRRMELSYGQLRSLEIRPGGIGEGPFIVQTPHCVVQVDQGMLSISITRDNAETQVTVVQGSARIMGRDSDRSFAIGPGYCTSVERGKLPNPVRPVLKLVLKPVAGNEDRLEATMINDGYLPIRVRRAIDSARLLQSAVYMLRVSYGSEYTPGTVPENDTLPLRPVTPISDDTDHSGVARLEPGQFYRFTFDVSEILMTSPPVVHWLRLEYVADLYAPSGEAKVRIQSQNLKLDRRSRTP